LILVPRDSGLDGVADAPRPGRPRKFAPQVVAEGKALACELPATTGAPLARWSCPELAREAPARGITPAISASTVRRWLAEDVLKPWQHRSWIFPRDPYFAVKAGACWTFTSGYGTASRWPVATSRVPRPPAYPR
jgi:hypothetical protein